MIMKEQIYKILFIDQKETYEIYAKSVADSDMHGFIEVSEIIFNTQSNFLVDPSEEKLKIEFADVKTTFIPYHSVIRVDAVEKLGEAKIKKNDLDGVSNVRCFPATKLKPEPTT